MNDGPSGQMKLDQSKVESLYELSNENILNVTRPSDLANQLLNLDPMKQTGGQVITKIKQESEAVIRSWVEANSTTTWQVMVDVISQTGRMSKETGKFAMRGERRAWVHASIDRMTGEVVDLEVEHLAE